MSLLIIKIVAFTILGTVIQIAAVVVGFIIANQSGAEFPLLITLYCYAPTIFLVQKTGNFVGCANMIEPFVIGVPMGAIVYSLFAATVITMIRRTWTSS